MPTLQVIVSEKIATYVKRGGAIVCGNSDYKIKFAFDEEWSEHTKKTARFIWGGTHKDVEFEGAECTVPIIKNADEVEVGVYAGDLETTTSAFIPCKKSILCKETPLAPDLGEFYKDEAVRAAESAASSAERAEGAAEEARESVGDVKAAKENAISDVKKEAATVKSYADAAKTSCVNASTAASNAAASCNDASSHADVARGAAEIARYQAELSMEGRPYSVSSGAASVRSVPAGAMKQAELKMLGGATKKQAASY